MAEKDGTVTEPPAAPDGKPRDPHRARPWRTEGLPKGQPAAKRPRWNTVVWIAGYALVFALLTMQDWGGKPRAVSYTEFKTQVAATNVTEVFARGSTIEGELRKPA